MKGCAFAPGTCGELVQGTSNKINFHITCPINCFSKVTIEIKKDRNGFLYINDPQRKKVIQAVAKTMKYLTGKLYPAFITVDSQLPIAKGMASSTADIGAACLATAKALSYELNPTEIKDIALSIEPSDGLFFPGIVAFDHVRGNYYRELGKTVDLEILVYDFGGELDTIVFNQRPDLEEKNSSNEPLIAQAFDKVKQGLITDNSYLVAEGATLSALANQKIIYKPNLERIIELVNSAGAYGINTAHSGTLIGILYEKQKTDYPKLKKLVETHFPYLSYIGEYKLINGGLLPASC